MKNKDFIRIYNLSVCGGIGFVVGKTVISVGKMFAKTSSAGLAVELVGSTIGALAGLKTFDSIHDPLIDQEIDNNRDDIDEAMMFFK